MNEFYGNEFPHRKKSRRYSPMTRLIPVPPDLYPGPRFPEAQPGVPLFDMVDGQTDTRE